MFVSKPQITSRWDTVISAFPAWLQSRTVVFITAGQEKVECKGVNCCWFLNSIITLLVRLLLLLILEFNLLEFNSDPGCAEAQVQLCGEQKETCSCAILGHTNLCFH